VSEKRQKFVNIAEKRVSKVLKGVALIGNLSNRSRYEYSEEDVAQIFSVINTAIAAMRARFAVSSTKKKIPFRLNSQVSLDMPGVKTVSTPIKRILGSVKSEKLGWFSYVDSPCLDSGSHPYQRTNESSWSMKKDSRFWGINRDSRLGDDVRDIEMWGLGDRCRHPIELHGFTRALNS
jgi:hypothetical protein